MDSSPTTMTLSQVCHPSVYVGFEPIALSNDYGFCIAICLKMQTFAQNFAYMCNNPSRVF